jgi:hypothetical protein
MFVTIKDGSHGEITLAEAQRIAMDIDAEEKEYVRLNLSKVLGPEMASIPACRCFVYGHVAFPP